MMVRSAAYAHHRSTPWPVISREDVMHARSSRQLGDMDIALGPSRSAASEPYLGADFEDAQVDVKLFADTLGQAREREPADRPLTHQQPVARPTLERPLCYREIAEH
jgi:hypothetical protein